jgi:riboflavin synthase
MFTGLIEAVGTVTRLEARPLGRWLEFEASGLDDLAIGDSIAVNGCCLTAVAIEGSCFAAEAVPETLARTTVGDLQRGSLVNLERALRMGDRLGGHMVQGHVDGVTTVLTVAAEGAGRRVRFGLPEPLAAFVVEKGSVAVDGISLTIAQCEPRAFEVAIIPHTLEHTIARAYRAGTRVNLEVDLVARYVVRMVETGRMERTTS